MTRAGQDVHVFSLKQTIALKSHWVWSDLRDCMKCPWIVIVDMPHGQHAARPPDRRGRNVVAQLIRALALISIAYAPKSTLYSRTCFCDSLARGTLRKDPA